MPRTGSAVLPLHYGKIPVWLASRMARLGAEQKLGTSTLGLHVADIRRRERRDDPDAGSALFTDDPTFVRDVTGAGVSLAIPKIADVLPINLYTELAYQKRTPFPDQDQKVGQGYAAYMAASYTNGPITASFEGKHYRAFNPVRLNADRSKYGAFQAVQYTANPTVELITQDSLFDNSCTTGGRGRLDIKATKDYTLFGSVGRFANWQQKCGAAPSFGLYDTLPQQDLDRHDITDLYTGFDIRADDGSYVTIMFGTRRETKAIDGEYYYREGWLQGNGSKVITGPYSIEVDTWHRNRYYNLEQWREGQTYISLKYKSRGAIIFGHEYSTRPSQINKDPNYKGSDILNALRFLPTNPDGDEDNDVQHFLNIGGQLKFGEDVIFRFLFGEQRAALKCVSGVCRFFPAFAGFRSELVVRY